VRLLIKCADKRMCIADDESGCCAYSRKDCWRRTSCRWDKLSAMCRGITSKDEAPKCVDIKISKVGSDEPATQEWTDIDADSCAAYRKKMWCNSNAGIAGGGGVGWAWNADDTFEEFRDPVSGLHAGEACCGCGGGDSKGTTQSSGNIASTSAAPNAPVQTVPAPTTPVCTDLLKGITWRDSGAKKEATDPFGERLERNLQTIPMPTGSMLE
jgi:hypothetical protein